MKPVALNFNQVYKDHKTIVSRYISNKIRNKEAAEELVSDVFIKISQHLSKFDGDKLALTTWVYTISKNILIDYFRKTLNAEGKPKLNTVSIDGDHDNSDHVAAGYSIDFATTDQNPLQKYIANETISNIKNAMNSLTNIEKKLLTLYAIKSQSYNEIATKLDMPVGTVKATIHRSRQSMKELMVNKI